MRQINKPSDKTDVEVYFDLNRVHVFRFSSAQSICLHLKILSRPAHFEIHIKFYWILVLRRNLLEKPPASFILNALVIETSTKHNWSVSAPCALQVRGQCVNNGATCWMSGKKKKIFFFQNAALCCSTRLKNFCHPFTCCFHAMPSNQDVQDQQRGLLLLKTIVTNLSLSHNFLFWSLNCLKNRWENKSR